MTKFGQVWSGPPRTPSPQVPNRLGTLNIDFPANISDADADAPPTPPIPEGAPDSRSGVRPWRIPRTASAPSSAAGPPRPTKSGSAGALRRKAVRRKVRRRMGGHGGRPGRGAEGRRVRNAQCRGWWLGVCSVGRPQKKRTPGADAHTHPSWRRPRGRGEESPRRSSGRRG